MTDKEIKEIIINKIVDGMKITFGTSILGETEKVCIFANSETTEEIMKHKAIIDDMVKMLTDNGYDISLNDLDISQYNGKRTSVQSVILRRNK